jgi:hypothetical protein
MGLRIAMEEGIPRHFIDRSVAAFEPRRLSYPDTFALRQLPMEKFCASMLPSIARPLADSSHEKRARWMAYQLHKLEMDYSRITLICSIQDWPWIKEAYDERLGYTAPEQIDSAPALFGVSKQTLFFALSEFPYITYLYEKNRQELRSDKNLSIDGVKEILLKSREVFINKHSVQYHNLTPQTFQIYLQYVRNLALMEHRLTPDLYTLAVSAKQIGGDAFAVALVETARDYPFQDTESGLENLALGMDKAEFEENNVAEMKNRLSETYFEWRNLNLKVEPGKQQQKKCRVEPESRRR